MKKFVIVNKGHGFVGKSSSIKMVYQKLQSLYPSNIKVINESNNTFIEVLGLSDNEVVIIDCKMGTVINSDNINRFEILQDYNLLELSKGDNNIRLNGNAKVEFICEFPIII